MGPSNTNHFITYATLDPTKQRPYVCVEKPSSAPDVSAAIYDDTLPGSFQMAMDFAFTSIEALTYTTAGGVSMKIT